MIDGQVLMCNVCNDEPAVGVASSALGALSLAYGHKCLTEGIEPYGLLVFTAADSGGLEHMADWFKELAERTRMYFNKTPEEFAADIANEIARIYQDEARMRDEEAGGGF